jgi:hypothetical protein
MRLPWRRERARPAAAVDETGPNETGLLESEAAESDALMQLAEAHNRSREVHAVVARLRELRESNHFAERVAQALRDGYGPDGR